MKSQSERNLLVVCDFDDTAADCNAAQLLLTEFGGPASQAIQESYRSGALSFREYQEEMFNTVTVSIEELSVYARENVRLRPGFRAAVETTRAMNGEFIIASAGIDFYIDPVLEAHGLPNVPILSVTGSPIRSKGGAMSFRYDYPSFREHCRDWAVCKCQPVELAKSSGEYVIFIGDGLRSDSCAAQKADTVFARSSLLEYCNMNKITAVEFENFHSITAYISRLNFSD